MGLNTPSRRLALTTLVAVIATGLVLIVALQPAGRGALGLDGLRPLAALSLRFWVQIAVGLGAFLIAAWIWALRPRDPAVLLFALSGAATMLFTYSAAAGGAAVMALEPWAAGLLFNANVLGASLFGVVMIALFLIYPVRPPGWRTAIVVATGVFAAWTGLELVGATPSWSSVHLITLVEMIGIFAAVGAQYLATRDDPRGRAVTIWLGLSVLVGSGAFITLVALPRSLGFAGVVDPRYAFSSFLLIYAGVAVGLQRYRLFELGEWAFLILFYLGGAALLVAVDAMLVYAASLAPASAFGVALLAVAFLYLPLRDTLARRLLHRSRLDEQQIFHSVVDVVFEPSNRARADRWRRLLSRVFAPLEIAPAKWPVQAPQIRADGLELALPGVADIPDLVLRYPWRGRGLFGSRHRRTAEHLITLMSHAEAGRAAYDRGVAEERSRIARDMHDNIGAQLLGALHSRQADRKDMMIRETLTDLRDVINNAASPGLTFDETLAELRAETAERLAMVDIGLDWSVEADDPPDLTPGAAHALRSIIREAVSNVIKHAGASQVRMRLVHSGGRAELTVEDDGAGFDATAASAGDGLANIRARVRALRGSLDLAAIDPGVRLTARFPLEHDRRGS
ncbi:histidine kinase [Marinicauda salina]|uniref:Histidine kinase n=1 Tax=Marinicauda salina TaxID=2135793 RepID=A0A2U2BS41_9PROT|nr:ATP-binding protein [Marinicauda salina]PWE16833.1 histidine kinase [Marinicauda salina]